MIDVLWLIEEELYTTKAPMVMPDIDIRDIMLSDTLKAHERHWLDPDPYTIPFIYQDGQPDVSYVKVEEES